MYKNSRYGQQASQNESLIIIHDECTANGFFKTSIYLLKVVKVKKGVMYFFLFLKRVDVVFARLFYETLTNLQITSIWYKQFQRLEKEIKNPTFQLILWC